MKRRRYFEVFLFVLIGLFTISGVSFTKDVMAADSVTLEVYNPSGAFEVNQTFAPRLADLNGKTICEVSDGLWESQRTFPLIRSLLQRQFPTAKIVPYDQFPIQTGADITVANIGDLVKAKGCQGVIVGNAG